MAAFRVHPTNYPVPIFTQDEIIEKIINGEGLSHYYEKTIPIVGVGKNGVKFERNFYFRSEENKKEKTVKNTEFKVTVIIPRTSRFLRHKEDFITRVTINEAREFTVITYIGISIGCL